MNWARAHYDRVAIAAAALFLIISSAFLWRAASGFAETFASIAATGGATAKLPPSKAQDLNAAMQKLPQPAQWTFNSKSGLFVPERHFVAPGGELGTLQSSQVHPPVPNEWFEQTGISIADADVLTQDPDGDGFNNQEEWEGHTDPTNKDSHPSYLTKLRMKSFVQEPFRLKFSSWVGDTFAINTIDLKQPTQFLKIGDLIPGTKFKLVSFTEKHGTDKYGTDVDTSEITLENQSTKEQLILAKEKVVTSPESVATLVYSWGTPKELTVKKDQEFSLPPRPEIKYKLLDVQPDKAVVVDTQKPNEKIDVPRLSP